MFAKVTSGNRQLFINPKHVIYLERRNDSTGILFSNGETLMATETVETITLLCEKACKEA